MELYLIGINFLLLLAITWLIVKLNFLISQKDILTYRPPPKDPERVKRVGKFYITEKKHVPCAFSDEDLWQMEQTSNKIKMRDKNVETQIT